MPVFRYTCSAARLAAVLLGSAVAFVASASPASAQYFGRNKVQYEAFDWQVLRTAPLRHLLLLRRAPIGRRSPRAWPSGGTPASPAVLHHELSGRQPLILYANQPDFQQTNVVGGIGEGTGGVTEALRARDRPAHRRDHSPIRPRARPRADPRLPVRHRGVGAGGGGSPRLGRCRSGSSRAWPSTSRSGPTTRSPRCGCAMRSRTRARHAAHVPPARRSPLLPLPLRPGAVGLRRRQLRRRPHRRAAPRRGPPARRGPGDPWRPRDDARRAGRPVARGDPCRVRPAAATSPSCPTAMASGSWA